MAFIKIKQKHMEGNNMSLHNNNILTDIILGKKKYFCSWCKKRIKNFKDNLSAKEYKISGLCSDCQDKTFK